MIAAITYRDIDSSPALDNDIRRRAAALAKHHPRILDCAVVVEARHQHHHKGKLFHVRITLRIPGEEIVVSRDPTEAHRHEDAYVAISDAFHAARRRLDALADRRLGKHRSPTGPIA